MAQKKSGGSTRNGRDSNAKNLGLKKNFNNFVKPGDILIRQRGNIFYPGINSYIGKDYTIISKIYGFVFFKKIKKKKYIYVL
ncbi:LSU ribosomal protein L27p [Candidatus Nasuia deltocephalinicola]|uniref:Large ribosomal subunit protein bL27 n=1 Tax=Candidatus Nasuia deltocephalincola TaxID=1160784 RepID=A0A7G6UHN7_9PROT|nr:LSU ribosomal protein L27p [Candidatus Nasuia deltocephalinicola]